MRIRLVSCSAELRQPVAGLALRLIVTEPAGDPAGELRESTVRRQQAAAPSSAEPAPPPPPHTELLGDFVLESREHLAAIESQLLRLERDLSNSEILDSILRGFHTIKGLAGFLELRDVQMLAQETEALLDRARGLEGTLDAAAIDVMLDSADHLRRWLSHMEAELRHRPSQAPAPNEPLLARLRALKRAATPPEPPTADLARLAGAVRNRSHGADG